jgi:hypothetical protein
MTTFCGCLHLLIAMLADAPGMLITVEDRRFAVTTNVLIVGS